MRKFTILLIITLCTHNLFAQQNSVADIREVYISSHFFTGSNFGLQYKTGLNDNTLLRIALLSLNSEVNKTRPPVSSSFTERRFNINGGVEIGIEKRKSITDKMSIFYGISMVCKSGLERTKIEDPSVPIDNQARIDRFYVYPGVGLNSGILLNIKEGFFLGAALTPQLLYTYQVNESLLNSEIVKQKRTGAEFNLNSESLRISLIYQWNKKQ